MAAISSDLDAIAWGPMFVGDFRGHRQRQRHHGREGGVLMAVPNEGTTALPSDASGRYFLGRWNGTVLRAADDGRVQDGHSAAAESGRWRVHAWTPALGKKWRVPQLR